MASDLGLAFLFWYFSFFLFCCIVRCSWCVGCNSVCVPHFVAEFLATLGQYALGSVLLDVVCFVGLPLLPGKEWLGWDPWLLFSVIRRVLLRYSVLYRYVLFLRCFGAFLMNLTCPDSDCRTIHNFQFECIAVSNKVNAHIWKSCGGCIECSTCCFGGLLVEYVYLSVSKSLELEYS